MKFSLGLQVIFVVVATAQTPVGSRIANCLQQTNGSYNIGCPEHPLQEPTCLPVNGTTNDSNPYSSLCDGVLDCDPANPVDEGTALRVPVNTLLDCEFGVTKQTTKTTTEAPV